METHLMLTGLLHWVVSVLVAFYPFIFPKTSVDLVYLLGFMLLLLGWTMYNGECMVTYWLKAAGNPSYEAGMSTNQPDDMILAVGYDTWVSGLLFLGQFMTCISAYLVFTRNQFPLWFTLPVVLTYFGYKTVSRLSSNHHRNRVFHRIQTFTQLLTWGYIAIYLHLLGSRGTR